MVKTLSPTYASQILWSADLVLILLLFIFRLMGYMYAKYFLRGSSFAKHSFKSTASTDTGEFFFFFFKSTQVHMC